MKRKLSLKKEVVTSLSTQNIRGGEETVIKCVIDRFTDNGYTCISPTLETAVCIKPPSDVCSQRCATGPCVTEICISGTCEMSQPCKMTWMCPIEL